MPTAHPRPITHLYAETLRERREKAGLTQKRAAEAADVSQAKISRWEAGAAQPTYAELRQLATAYECKLSELAPRNQYPSAPLDPEERKTFMRRRNAAISKVDVEEYMEAMAEQDKRMAARPSALPKEKS
jgi:transcriptional regulator with XRE-family HTH domain